MSTGSDQVCMKARVLGCICLVSGLCLQAQSTMEHDQPIGLPWSNCLMCKA